MDYSNTAATCAPTPCKMPIMEELTSRIGNNTFHARELSSAIKAKLGGSGPCDANGLKSENSREPSYIERLGIIANQGEEQIQILASILELL